MAVPTNTYQTASVVGVREDLGNVVFNLDPAATPLQSALPRVKVTATLHEWLTDELADASASNAAIQGADASNASVSPATRLGNYTQISTKTAQVAGTNSGVNSAGNVAKMGYVIMNKIKELKRDTEKSLFDAHSRVAPTTTVAGKSAGIPAWLTSNVDLGTGGTPAAATGDGTDTPTVGTTKRDLSESLVKGVLLKAFNNTGDIPKLAFAYPKHKQIISSFSGNGTRYVEVKKDTLSTSFEFYESDFGTIKVVPSIFQDASSLEIINPKYMKMGYLRPFERNRLAKTGDSEQVQVLQEWTLEVSNEKAHCAIYALK